MSVAGFFGTKEGWHIPGASAWCLLAGE